MRFPDWFYAYGWWMVMLLVGIILAEMTWLVR